MLGILNVERNVYLKMRIKNEKITLNWEYRMISEPTTG